MTQPRYSYVTLTKDIFVDNLKGKVTETRTEKGREEGERDGGQERGRKRENENVLWFTPLLPAYRIWDQEPESTTWVAGSQELEPTAAFQVQ